MLTMTSKQSSNQHSNSSNSSILSTELALVEKKEISVLSDAMETLMKQQTSIKHEDNFNNKKDQLQLQDDDGQEEEEVDAPPMSMEPQQQQLQDHTGVGAVVKSALSNNGFDILRSSTVSPALDVPTIAADITRLETDRSSPMPDLSVSPLTASSYHVMEREYDRDTWRMYRRIASSRPTNESGVCTQSAPRYNNPSPLQQRQLKQEQHQLQQQQYLLSKSYGGGYGSSLASSLLYANNNSASIDEYNNNRSLATGDWGHYYATEEDSTEHTATTHTHTHLHTQTQNSNRSSSTLDVNEELQEEEYEDESDEIFDLDLE